MTIVHVDWLVGEEPRHSWIVKTPHVVSHLSKIQVAYLPTLKIIDVVPISGVHFDLFVMGVLVLLANHRDSILGTLRLMTQSTEAEWELPFTPMARSSKWRRRIADILRANHPPGFATCWSIRIGFPSGSESMR